MQKQFAILFFCSLSFLLYSGCASTVPRSTTYRNYIYCAAVQDNVLITGGGGGLDAYDITHRAVPSRISSVFTGSAVAGIAVRWPYIFAACGRSGLITASFKDPQSPKVENVCDLQMNALAVDIIDSFALVIGIENYRGYLKIVALKRMPPQVTDSFNITGSMSSIHCEDSMVFVCGTESWTGFLRTYAFNKVSGKIKPLSGIALDAPAWHVTSSSHLVIASQGDKGAFFVKTDASGRLFQVASTHCGKFAKEGAIADSLVFVLNEKQGITVLDLAGNVRKTISIKGIAHFAISYPYIYAFLVNKSIRVITYG